MMIRHIGELEGAHGGTRQRVIECRRRLRRTRVTERALRPPQDEAVIAASEILSGVMNETDFVEAEEIFEKAGADFSRKSRHFASAVDRRTGLRAR
ncbi:MAG TPA: hypothetical protein VF779_05055 [Pyrinomonadaceae bacterium]